ncbi:hypothetical protein N234_17157 [Ralstonia pickettii DTP0602]|nr:hypothetical protein N234_17157 [Ralstonia pickettii DTP0602]
MKRKRAIKELEENLRELPQEELLALFDSLYSRVKTEIAQGKQYSHEDIRRINNSRKSIQRFKERLKGHIKE